MEHIASFFGTMELNKCPTDKVRENILTEMHKLLLAAKDSSFSAGLVFIIHERADLQSAAQAVLKIQDQSLPNGCKILIIENLFDDWKKILLASEDLRTAIDIPTFPYRHTGEVNHLAGKCYFASVWGEYLDAICHSLNSHVVWVNCSGVFPEELHNHIKGDLVPEINSENTESSSIDEKIKANFNKALSFMNESKKKCCQPESKVDMLKNAIDKDICVDPRKRLFPKQILEIAVNNHEMEPKSTIKLDSKDTKISLYQTRGIVAIFAKELKKESLASLILSVIRGNYIIFCYNSTNCNEDIISKLHDSGLPLVFLNVKNCLEALFVFSSKHDGFDTFYLDHDYDILECLYKRKFIYKVHD